MMKVIAGAILLVGISVSMPGWAWGGCDAGSKEPKPDWVSKPDYAVPGHYVGVGSSEKEGKSKDEQSKASEDNAKSHLAEQIEVTIKAENEQSTRVSKQGVQQDQTSKLSVKAEEVLRDLKIKGRWTDQETCTQYTLIVISKESVAQAKRERIMKNRLEMFKTLLAAGSDRDKNRDVKVRRRNLEEAQALLRSTDFGLLPEEAGKEVYADRLSAALEQLNRESSQAKGRTALFALDPDGRLSPEVLGKMLDQLRTKDSTMDRLMADCSTVDECISRARERGFTMLALLKTNSRVETSPMGALKGILSISKSVYDIESGKVVKGGDTASAQVIGWSNEELDWNSAAEKAMQGIK